MLLMMIMITMMVMMKAPAATTTATVFLLSERSYGGMTKRGAPIAIVLDVLNDSVRALDVARQGSADGVATVCEVRKRGTEACA